MLAREIFGGPHVWHSRRALPQDAQKGLPARPQAYPQGYVEDLSNARTTLEDFFSILLRLRGC
jgi:hypothetical protein